jgi:hypothetical protein
MRPGLKSIICNSLFSLLPEYGFTGSALCFACHGLKSRLERIRAAEAKGVIDPLAEEE